MKIKQNNVARRFAVGAAKVTTAAVIGLAAFVASPEHILKNQAPIPLAFTI